MSDSPITDPLAWRPIKAPSLLDLEILAGTVFAGLPDKFRGLCEGLVIRVEDFAEDEVLDDMEIDDPFALMGGVGCSNKPGRTPERYRVSSSASSSCLRRASGESDCLHQAPPLQKVTCFVATSSDGGLFAGPLPHQLKLAT